MSSHNIEHQIHDMQPLPDPGASGTIVVERSPCVCELTSATTETRTLSRPTNVGVQLLLTHKTDGGDITVTVTGGLNESGDTTIVFSDPGQFAKFESMRTAASTYVWRLTSHYGLGNVSPTESGALDGLLATVTELNRSSDVSTRIVDCTASTLVVTEALHDGKIITLNRAAGIAVTLPAAAAGLWFRFIVHTTFTGASSIKSVAGTDIMIGHALMGNDSDNTVVDFQSIAASTNDTIDLLGTGNSTGGMVGQEIEIIGMPANAVTAVPHWYVSIRGDAAGTEATPFANTVA